MDLNRAPSPSTPASGTARRGRLAVAVGAVTALVTAGLFTGGPTVVNTAVAASATTAPGGPGAMSHFDLARKDCLGTARNTTSRVWFTVANGVLSDVYYPTIDNTNVETLQLMVTDGATFTDLQTRDMTYTVRALDASGMSCRVTSTAKNGRYTLTTDYVTDPARASVVMRVRLEPSPSAKNLKVYARYDATANGNGGGGAGDNANAGADDAVTDRSTGSPVPVSLDTVTATIAANRDYATPVYGALRADRPFRAVSSGFAGTAGDGLAQLDADHRLATTQDSALHGNVVQTAQLDLKAGRPATLALGFGTTQAGAVATAGASASADTGHLIEAYQAGWAAYDSRLNPPARISGPSWPERGQLQGTYYLAANVIKASEDKTFPGAIAAGLASPWGQAVAAGDPALTYFGSYREVFARDLYETFSGLVADGDLATARDTVRFLFLRQQQADGSMPRNSLPNGKLAPDSFGTQLDEVSYPILMARIVGLTDKTFYTDHIKRAADFVVAHGPAFGSERWEEQSGYSPSTIAAQIAGLTAAGAIAELDGDAAGARIYRATADHYQRTVKAWTLTSNGPASSSPYFVRLSKTGDPNAAVTYNLGNGGPDADQRAVIDQGFLELVRLGALAAGDPDVANSLTVVDSTIRRTAKTGDGFYRYGTATPGTEDGYGDCNTADPTDCAVQGKPWAGTCAAQGQNKGSGHLWPALAAERGEQAIATGSPSTASALWRSMAGEASGIGLLPEQAWEDAPLAATPFGTAPECASIGFDNGKAAGSASPLTWSEASFVRLSTDLRTGRITDRPLDTTYRYLTHTQAGTTVTLTPPTLVNDTATVSGATDPGAAVDVDAVNTDVDGAATRATTRAGSDGKFTVSFIVPAGTDTITVLATARSGATGYAQATVVYDVVPGTQVFDATDPSSDDNGPGTYAYPLPPDVFQAGAFDLRDFQVYDSGPDSVTFRVRTGNQAPTFGSPLGAQLVDVYLHNLSGGTTSTAASYPQRNYTIAPASAWNRLIEVQGFGQRFVDAAGTTLGSVATRASVATGYITFTVSKTALGGTPGPGWSFAVVLTGQDGFSPDQARGFQATAQPYQFGVCTAAAVTANDPLCAVDPSTVPKAIDVLTPTGVSQASELNPLNGPVVIQGVSIA